ncbi:MAG: YqeG family HAD IIIA-type phosphatase [Francisellaceae bacterium]
MLTRMIYTIKQTFKYRKAIDAINRPEHQLTTITDLTALRLKDLGIVYLALDFDGVLAPHGQALPDDKITSWLLTFCESFSADHIFILSNKPTAERRAFFARYFPAIRFISGVRKKPYTDGLEKILELAASPADKLALVDDRLLTGCLACIKAGSFAILVMKPFRNFRRRAFQEGFFAFLRWLERRLFIRR